MMGTFLANSNFHLRRRLVVSFMKKCIYDFKNLHNIMSSNQAF